MRTWLDSLREDKRLEFGDKPLTAALATARTNNGRAAAANRMVVVRDVADDGRLTIASDARSEKNAQLVEVPRSSLLVWFADRRRQYRLAGPIDVLGARSPQAADVWRSMTDTARALFAWPTPGAPRSPDAVFAEKVPADAAVPGNFELLVLTPASVDVLDLNTQPHTRTIWTPAETGWVGTLVNP